jgi:uncharacterized protein YyaL (SSP411 family)
MDEHKYVNDLIKETSPYLLQHAHNPVNWHAWNDAALQKAKEEDKPILVSIGYSACHWCHVMERESFEDESTAQIMNEHFVNIKIDREERPDIDHIYMDAVQAITGSGGWPLNVFLTPDLRPFFGGTYFPPVRAYNRSSWKEVLVAVATAWKEKKEEINEQAEHLTQHLLNVNNLNANNELASFSEESTNLIAENLIKFSDKEWGGFGQAPKFPQTFSILYLLRHYHLTGNEDSLKTALLSLDKMMMGGIYDHLGGGFCRYSTDRRWQIPHFEKMLYDNALLIDAYTEAYQLTKREDYANIVRQTVAFIQREMTSPEGGFYSAFDADSEGVEGKYYTWTRQDIDELLGAESPLFCHAYNITEAGNWEDTNILWMPEALEEIAATHELAQDELSKRLDASRQILLAERQQRIKPGLDNKVLLSWNALMISSLCKSYDAWGVGEYRQLARANIGFIEKHLFNENDGSLLHSWNKAPGTQHAFLDDYAALIQACISLHQSTNNNSYLLKAKKLTEEVIEIFSDEEDRFFYFTPKQQADILVRKIETFDGAVPSGNSLMANNLIKLSVIFDIPAWNDRAGYLLSYILSSAKKYPTYFGVWNLNIELIVYGLTEIAIVGKNYADLLRKVVNEYIPLKIVQASAKSDEDWPLLREKIIPLNQTNIYICRNYSCLKPAESFEEFKDQLTKHF